MFITAFSQISLRTLAAVLLAWLIAYPQVSQADDPAFSIRLIDGSVGYGELLSSQQDDQLGFHVQGFKQAFRYQTDQVHSIRRLHWKENQLEANAPDSLLFSLRGRDQVVGKIVSMNDRLITIQSELLGTVTIAREDLLRISKSPDMGRSIKSVIEANDWKDPNNLGLWDATALQLSTSQAGSRLLSNYEMPQQAELKISLQWKGKPRFSIGLGVESDKKLNELNVQWGLPEGQEPLPTTGRFRSFASLEVWGNSLVLVREAATQGDFAHLFDLESQTSCELTVYLDLRSGVAAVQSFDGKLYQLQVEPNDVGQPLKAVSLQNFDSNLSVERLELSTWSGQLPIEFTTSKSTVLKRDDSTIDGVIDGWDEATASWIIRTPTEQLNLPADELKLANFEPAETTEPSTSHVELTLLDGSRLKGRLLASDEGEMAFQPNVLTGSHRVRLNQISEITNRMALPAEDASGVKKVAVIGLSQIRGVFLDDTPEGSSTALHWKPNIGLNTSELDYAFSGEIRLDASPKVPRKSQVAEAEQPEQPVVAQQNFNIFQQLFGGAVARPVQLNIAAKKKEKKQASMPVSSDTQIRFRSGDATPATVRGISEAGVQFESTRTSTTFAPNKAVDQIFFRPAKGSKLSDDERKRLLTIPRAQKNDPPTHLVISIAGDYLRGHLVEVTPQKTTVEVRGEMMEFPTEELSEIVWLYDRNWSTTEPKEATESQEPQTGTTRVEESALAVHAVVGSAAVGNDQGLTLLPQKVQAGVLAGKSDILGESTVKLDEVIQLFFGPDTSLNARKRRNETYELKLAQLPKEQISPQGGSDSPAGRHPLAGTPAPEFSLNNLSDKPIQLTDQHGQITVLDFWASWCGPCMQAMPQLDQLIEEFSDQKVQLIAVNIQETKPRIELAMQRLETEREVVLDVDGEVAAAYKANAIPQTVIIDKAGVIVDVIVGGGPNALDQIRQTITGILLKENDPTRAN